MPPPAGKAGTIYTSLPCLRGKQRAKAVPPVPYCLVADVGAALVQKVLYLTQRQRKSDIRLHRQADNLWRGLEIAKGIAFRHPTRVGTLLSRLKPVSFDNALLAMAGGARIDNNRTSQRNSIGRYPMARDPRYDILFEPIKIGPVTAPNRFYQVPHCNGMGRVFPDSMIAMRGMKAAGGWGIVCTEQCDFHHSADITPYTETRLWDDADIGYLAGMCNAIHEHGSLAGIELVHNGHTVANLYSREIPIGPSHRPVVANNYPGQARAMDKQDIRNYRRWHRNAALRSKEAGFDLVVVYHGHDGTVPSHFLSKRQNQRTDEYGGSLENRLRLYRELLEETKDAVGDCMGVVARFAVDEMMGSAGLEWEHEGREALEMLAEIPDMWDVNVSDWSNDSMPSRFAPEGYQEDYVRFVKQVTSKPVATVGRYTSPDTMVSAIRNGIVDLIGAARPSIADPFLPRKIEEGRPEDIRECIGCNICVAWDLLSAPIRCTQNPTMSEEWRKGWHPEEIAEKASDFHVLVVGFRPGRAGGRAPIG